MNDSPPVPADRVRQVGVTLSEIFCVIGTLVGVGVLGTAVSDTAGGALSADATLLAPAGTAFSIWSVVYLGLAAFTVWQWLPAQRADPRMRSTGWLAAASMVLNASWLLVTQQGWIWFSVVVIAALLATLVAIIRLLTLHPARSVPERVVVDGTFGLYLGWVAVATCANLAAALVASDVGVGAAAAVVVIAIVTVAGVVLAVRYGARWTVAAASAWGLAWIAVGRLGAEPRSTTTALVALVAAAVVLGAVAAVRAGRLAPASAPS
jgi:hypothetical protein